jgi:hypothetical protein
MPIITKPSSIQKNSPAEISLDKSALAAVTSVAANAYYSDSANWKEVFIYYKSSVGNQREVLKFNATISSPVSTFLVSEKARDIFEVQKIVIVDFDNGSITVPRSQLTVAEFDVDMSTAPISSGIIWESKANYTSESDGGLTSTNTNTAESAIIYSATSIDTSSDFEIIYNIDVLNFANYYFFGFSNQERNVWGGYTSDTTFQSLILNNSLAVYPVTLPVGSHVLRFTKIGTDFTIRLNGNITFNQGTYTFFPVITPAVRLMSTNHIITSSTVVGVAPFNVYFERDFMNYQSAPPMAAETISGVEQFGYGWNFNGSDSYVFALLSSSPVEERTSRIYFDPSNASVGMQIGIRSGGAGSDYVTRTINSSDIQKGYIETVFKTGADIANGSSIRPSIQFQSGPGFLTLQKIQIGDLV